MSWFQKTIILNDTYVKIWVNPFENNVPEVLMNEIKTKMIPLPQLKPGGAKFKSFETMYGSPDSHTAKDRPLTRRQKDKSVAPGYSLSGKQRDVIKCFECNRERVVFSTHKLNQKERGFLDQIKQTIHFRCSDTLISEDQEYQALKDKKVCVDRRKTCSMPLETQIYLLKKQTVCSLFLCIISRNFE